MVTTTLASVLVSPTELTNTVPRGGGEEGLPQEFLVTLCSSLSPASSGGGWGCHFPLLLQTVDLGRGQAVLRVSWAASPAIPSCTPPGCTRSASSSPPGSMRMSVRADETAIRLDPNSAPLQSTRQLQELSLPSVFGPTPPALPGCRLGWVAVTEVDHLLRVTGLTGRRGSGALPLLGSESSQAKRVCR